MNAKQRVLAVWNRQPVDRIPVDLWYTGEVYQELLAHTGQTDELGMAQALGVDKIVWVGMPYSGSLRPAQEGDCGVTHWGTRQRAVRSGLSTYAENADAPLAGYDTRSSLEDYPWWPDAEQFDVEAALTHLDLIDGRFATIGPWVSFFEVYCAMRGLEQSLMDVLINPDFVDAALDRIEAIQTRQMRRLYDRAGGRIDGAFISDDMGSQNGLLMAVDSWRSLIGPRLKRWCDMIHNDYGMKVLYHSDGAVRELLPGLIEAGIDVLNPIQHVCPGMDLEGLKRDFGQRLMFHGGVDTQKVLPFGTPDDVRRETRDCLRALGQGRQGFVCCSCHNIQAGTPVENILAMIQTVHEEGAV